MCLWTTQSTPYKSRSFAPTETKCSNTPCFGCPYPEPQPWYCHCDAIPPLEAKIAVSFTTCSICFSHHRIKTSSPFGPSVSPRLSLLASVFLIQARLQSSFSQPLAGQTLNSFALLPSTTLILQTAKLQLHLAIHLCCSAPCWGKTGASKVPH